MAARFLGDRRQRFGYRVCLRQLGGSQMSLRSLGRLVLCLFIVALAIVTPAVAEIGAIDNVPAATLLLPRFEVDLVDPTGLDTLFSVNNASDVPALAHVTVWTELSIPVLDFDIYLTGYDVQTIGMRDLLVNGTLPQTGEAISNVGILSTPGSFANCNTGTTGPQAPIYDQLPESFLQFLQEELSGRPLSLGPAAGLCTSAATNTDVARGYITIDSVSSCSLEFPSSATYFSDGGAGVANNRNVLWGDWFFVSRAEELAWGSTLVHIEASNELLASNNSCDPLDGDPSTFYCRYNGGERQPRRRQSRGSGNSVRSQIPRVRCAALRHRHHLLARRRPWRCSWSVLPHGTRTRTRRGSHLRRRREPRHLGDRRPLRAATRGRPAGLPERNQPRQRRHDYADREPVRLDQPRSRPDLDCIPQRPTSGSCQRDDRVPRKGVGQVVRSRVRRHTARQPDPATALAGGSAQAPRSFPKGKLMGS